MLDELTANEINALLDDYESNCNHAVNLILSLLVSLGYTKTVDAYHRLVERG